MMVRVTLGVLVAFAMCFLAQRSAADDLKEIAAFKVADRQVRCVALAPDGTRLAAAVGYPAGREHKKRKENLCESILWDLATSTQLSRQENPGVSFLFFSANSKTLITVEDGFNGGLQTRHGYQAWDGMTGREIGSRIAPAQLGEFTTAAVSPDGKYLATVFNAEVTIERDTTKPFLVREVTVWDLQEHKVKWRLPGAMHLGRVVWSDSLAFSPDGKKLAFAINGSSGPSSESTVKARPDRPDANLSKLKMLTLEDGKEAPAVTVLDMAFPIEGRLQWLSGGKFLVSREDRLLDVRDPATGQRKTTIALQFPTPAPPKAKGNALPPPKGSPNAADIQFGWDEAQTALSADGTRLAGHHLIGGEDRSKPPEDRVVFWEVRGRKLLGGLVLGEAAMAPANWKPDRHNKSVCIALSGDGGRLAVGLLWGTVHVYDVSKLSGLVKATPADAAAKEAVDAAAVRKAYEATVLKARGSLLAQFDERIGSLEKTISKGKSRSAESIPRHKEDLARLKYARERFEKHDQVPWSEGMWSETVGYLHKVRDARAQVLGSYGVAELPGDLRELIDKRVIACWIHEPGGVNITLYSSGRVNDPAGDSTWTFLAGELTIRWKNTKAPGGYFLYRLFMASDGLSYSGTNQLKAKVSGKLVQDEP